MQRVLMLYPAILSGGSTIIFLTIDVSFGRGFHDRSQKQGTPFS
jgi:hypothetical protein